MPAPPPLQAGDLVFSDFDGTISREDVGLAVITAVGDQRAWDLEDQWRRGEIGSRECLLGQWDLVRWPEQRILDFLETIDLDDGFNDLYRLAVTRGARLVIVSDGLDYYLDRLMARLGYRICEGDKVLAETYGDCLPCFVNHAEYRGGGLQLSFPYTSTTCPECANCKLDHLVRLRPHFKRVIYIGDGHSDRCPAREADVVFAKTNLAELLSEEGLGYVPFVDLREVAEALAGTSRGRGYEVLDHTADYALRAWGRDLGEIIANAGRGMISFMADVEGLEPAERVERRVEAETPEYLVHHALRELLHLDEDGLLPVTVEAQAEEAKEGPLRAGLTVGVVPLDRVRERLRGEIKAVTYHNLAIGHDADWMFIEVVFDT